MRPLFHYTCRHSRAKIGDPGKLLPLGELVAGPHWLPPTSGYVWLTDLSVPIPAALGLTSYRLACDRTEYRYRVTDAAGVRPWLEVRRSVGPWADMIELAPGARPAHWYIAEGPVPVELDPIGVNHHG